MVARIIYCTEKMQFNAELDSDKKWTNIKKSAMTNSSKTASEAG